ncbi:MAG: anti-sigma factor [Chloroflexi bacterium OHK40]
MQPEPSDEITDLLVAYALGVLEAEEMQRIGRLLDERPELRPSLAELQATAGLLPYGLPLAAPPADLRQRTLDHAVGRAPRAPSAGAANAGRRLRGWLYALGGLAAAALAALAFTLAGLGSARAELAATRERLAQVEQQLALAEGQLAAVLTEQSQLAQAVVGADSVSALEGAGGLATALQSADGEVVIAARLPPLAADQVYQLWVIAGQSAPVSGGTFTVDSEGYGVIALGPGAAPSGVTLAVTAEPAPGSPGPTTPILVSGQLS